VNANAEALRTDEAALLAFERSLRWRHARGRGAAAALRLMLAFVVPVALAAWLLPGHRSWLLAGLLVATAGAALFGGLAGHRTATAALLRWEGVAIAGGGDFDLLSDELTTWLELHRARQRPALLPWLSRDVAARLPSLASEPLRQIGRGRLRRWLWLLPLLFVAVLAWLFCEWFAPPWSGLLGGRPTEPPPAAKPEPLPEPQPEPVAGGSDIEQPQRRQPRGERPPAPPPGNDEQTPPPPPDGAPPPLLDLPAQQRFLLPEFEQDGPTRRVRMHAAATEQGAASASAPSGSSLADPSPPPSPLQQFERAEEQALQSRHVPEHERAMVRRFFQALREAAK
jgi:hypothetical protein